MNCSPSAVVPTLDTCITLSAGGAVATQRLDLAAGQRTSVVTLCTDRAEWMCHLTPRQRGHGPEHLTELEFVLRLDAGVAAQSSIRLEFELPDWSEDAYLFMPAAVYGGNRFERPVSGYPPVYPSARNLGPGTPPMVEANVIGLSCEKAPALSRVEQLSRDLATPAVGAYLPDSGGGFLLLAEPTCGGADIGLAAEELDDRSRLRVQLLLPGRRPEGFYDAPWRRNHPQRTPWADVRVGDSIRIRLLLAHFASEGVQGLFDRFFTLRSSLVKSAPGRHMLPFSAAFAIQQRKFLRDNWNQEHRYIAVSPAGNWQTGWCGCLISTYPLLMDGGDATRRQVAGTFDFAFDTIQSSSGLFRGAFGEKGVCESTRDLPGQEAWHLMRKSSDALYFLLKQMMLLRDRGEAVPQKWAGGIQRCADAFVRIWQKNRQLGHLTDAITEEIRVGGSTSAGIAPAGLALAAAYFGDRAYLRAAEEIAADFYARFVRAGMTTGGPGDALTAPDSESAFGLLESFVTLYEATGQHRWIGMAEDLARQCASWVTSYDYPLPPDSTFGKLQMQTTGAVWANVQNKHGAPGICTLSGASLFRLFRATGDLRYLELIRDIAHAIPQFLSRANRPVGKLPEGWMCERVNLSDWMEPSGEIFNGSCWCEISLMLSYIELPGVYANPDTGLVCAIDHVDAKLARGANGAMELQLQNPTAFPAEVKVWSELSAARTTPLGPNYLVGARRVLVPAGGSASLPL